MTDKTTAEREAVAKAIWAVLREHEDRCDMELSDMPKDHPVWECADAARASLPLPGAQEAVAKERFSIPLERVIHAGYMLSNCAFNLSQRAGDVLTSEAAKTLGDCRKDWDEACAAFKAAPQPALSAGWRDISTVPKDGTEIILRRGTRVGAAQWCHWPGDEFEEAGAGWTACWDGDSWDGEKAPTNWQPLPVAPSMDGESNG